jgi:hypothetical protein
VPADDFDFWLGSWRAGWDGGEGTNEVTRILGGRVIHERFRTDGFEGLSVSVHDPESDTWRQTWVDSEGNYLDFVGSRVDDGAVDLRREAADGLYRMLWHELEADRFSWRWERSADGGASWEPRWLIAYTRLP